MNALSLAQRDSIRRKVKQRYLALRRQGAAIPLAHMLTRQYAYKELLYGEEGAWTLTELAREEIDGEEYP